MRKIIFGLIATIAISNTSFGQATLEHSYTTKMWRYLQTNAFKTESGLNYYTLNSSTGTLLIYNTNHTLIRTVNITIPNGYRIYGLYAISDKLFNVDSLIEFIMAFVKEDSAGPDILSLISENGTVLQQYGNKHEAFIIKGTDTEFKLITISDPYSQDQINLNFQYDVYSLPGTTMDVVQNIIDENSFFSFPNPTQNRISITNILENGQKALLEIFDLNGKKVMEKNVIGDNTEINIDVTELSNGIYIYKLNGQRNRFIKR